MISFALPEQLMLARSLFEELACEVVRPAAREGDRQRAIAPSMLEPLFGAGLIQAGLNDGDPDACQPRLRNCLLLEELGHADASTAVLVGAAIGYVAAIIAHGTPDQRATLRQDHGDGRPRGGMILVQEAGFGADPGCMTTRAVATTDGYRLTGRKSFVPMVAGWDDMIVIAACEEGHGAFLVSRRTARVSIEAAAPTLGLRALRMGSAIFDDVVLPREARLGGRTFDVQPLLSASRLGNGAILTGLSRAVFEHITPYTKERVVHGTPLAQKQSVAFRLAGMAMDVPAMRWAVWRGAVALEKGRSAAREARLAQLQVARDAVAIADEGIQLMGGHGYMEENPVERWFRDARTLTLLEGVTGI